MNTLVKKTSQIGQVREKCKESNITNIHDIASLYHQQKNIQIKDGTLCYEMITEKGSDAVGVMSHYSTKVQQESIIYGQSTTIWHLTDTQK